MNINKIFGIGEKGENTACTEIGQILVFRKESMFIALKRWKEKIEQKAREEGFEEGFAEGLKAKSKAIHLESAGKGVGKKEL